MFGNLACFGHISIEVFSSHLNRRFLRPFPISPLLRSAASRQRPKTTSKVIWSQAYEKKKKTFFKQDLFDSGFHNSTVFSSFWCVVVR